MSGSNNTANSGFDMRKVQMRIPILPPIDNSMDGQYVEVREGDTPRTEMSFSVKAPIADQLRLVSTDEAAIPKMDWKKKIYILRQVNFPLPNGTSTMFFYVDSERDMATVRKMIAMHVIRDLIPTLFSFTAG